MNFAASRYTQSYFRDLAKILGCLIGLRDEVTAITIVTFGTSLIDVFATRIASVKETTADNSIGNVMAANAISVFLGIYKLNYNGGWSIPPPPQPTNHKTNLRISDLIYNISSCFIFLGLGAPWLVASIYWEITNPLVGFNVKAAGLEFSTTLYIILGVIGRTGFV